VLIDKNEFKIGYQFLQHIEDIDHFKVLVDNIINIAGQVGGQKAIQCFGDHFYVNESPGLLAVALDCNKPVEICLKYEFVDYSIEAHALAIAIYVSTTHDISVDLADQSPHVLLAPQLGHRIECLRIRWLIFVG